MAKQDMIEVEGKVVSASQRNLSGRAETAAEYLPISGKLRMNFIRILPRYCNAEMSPYDSPEDASFGVPSSEAEVRGNRMKVKPSLRKFAKMQIIKRKGQAELSAKIPSTTASG